jgi:hypothetical protein
MKLKDKILLKKVINEIKKISGIVGIAQTGSSTYSENYRDVDIIVFFDKILPPPKLGEIADKYKKYKFSIEGAYIKDYKIDKGMKVFIKFFQTKKYKIILYGKDPFLKTKITLKKQDIACYIRYHYNFAHYTGDYDTILSVSLNAMLIYKNKSPKNKDETLDLFIKVYPKLAKFLPKNAKYYLRHSNKNNFKNLYNFFQKSMEFFSK